jgi:NAD(P)-dependent dehydrogenase (short-subunit alcohol dehydrogenase family)
MLQSFSRVIKSRWMSEVLLGKTVLITGAARRLGRSFALACARAGADIVTHLSNSTEEAEAVRQEITRLVSKAWIFQADFTDPVQAASLIPSINKSIPLFALINSAAIFDSLSLQAASLQA